MTIVEQRAAAILRRLKPGQTVAEVGVWHGQLSELLLRSGLNVIMVDNWLPGELQSDRYKETKDFHSTLVEEKVQAAEICARGRAGPFGDQAKIIKANSTEAARATDDKSLDMVFLDADHSYDGVKEDIHEWMPKVQPGGWIGGHDYGEPPPGANVGKRFGVTEAVQAMIPPWYKIEEDENMTWFVRL